MLYCCTVKMNRYNSIARMPSTLATKFSWVLLVTSYFVAQYKNTKTEKRNKSVIPCYVYIRI